MISWITNGDYGNFADSPFMAQMNPSNPYDYGCCVTYWPYSVYVPNSYYVDGQLIQGGITYPADWDGTGVPFPVCMVPWGDGNICLPTTEYLETG